MGKELLNSIVALTRAREPEILSESLLSSLAEHVPLRGISKLQLLDQKNLTKCERTVSLTINESDDGPFDQIWDEKPHRFRLQENVVEKIPSGKSFTCKTDQGLSVYVPILEESIPRSLIKIDTPFDISDRSEMIQTIVEVYTNLLQVLEDGQRDKLTGLLNRRTFDSKLFRMMELQRNSIGTYAGKTDDRRTTVNSKLAWLAIIDIDHFKRVNDQYGHVYGDEVILTVAQQMKQSFRSNDLLFRFGGEEFVVILEPMPPSNAMIALDRFRTSIETHVFQQIGGVTVSVGFAGLMNNEYPPAVIDRADQALYYAKEHGRNQVASYEALIDVGHLPHKKAFDGGVDLF